MKQEAWTQCVLQDSRQKLFAEDNWDSAVGGVNEGPQAATQHVPQQDETFVTGRKCHCCRISADPRCATTSVQLTLRSRWGQFWTILHGGIGPSHRAKRLRCCLNTRRHSPRDSAALTLALTTDKHCDFWISLGETGSSLSSWAELIFYFGCSFS